MLFRSSTGISIYGADLYVDEDQHETALEVYNAYFAGKAEIDEADLIQEALNAENPEELDPDEVDMMDDTEDEVPEDEV